MSTRSLSFAARAARRESQAPEDRAQEIGEAAPVEHTRPRRRSGKRVFSIAVVLAALGGGGYAYTLRAIESTDDAQLDADVVAVAARSGGAVTAVHFEENQRVEAGQLLAELDDAPARAKLAQADANLAAAEAAAHAADAQAELTQRNARGELAVASAGLQSSTVNARSTLSQIAEAEARVENAEARLREAEQNLARTETLFQSGAASNAQFDQVRSARDVAATELTRSEAARASVTLSRDQAQSRVAEAQAKLSQSDQVDALLRQAHARAEQAQRTRRVRSQRARDPGWDGATPGQRAQLQRHVLRDVRACAVLFAAGDVAG